VLDEMAKAGKKGKSPKRPQGSRKFDENALEHLTSQIDQNLKGGRDQKRKNPPASDSTSRDSKRQRSSSGAPKSASKDDTELLLAEIKALGGDEKDLDLIRDVNSDDEELANEQKQSVDKSLKDELLAFSKSLGFADYQPSEASEEEAEADQDDGGDAEEDDEDSLGSDEEEVNGEDEDEDEEEQEAPPKKIGNMVGLPYSTAMASQLTERARRLIQELIGTPQNFQSYPLCLLILSLHL
jgi:ribosome biogenesis protein MAK21